MTTGLRKRIEKAELAKHTKFVEAPFSVLFGFRSKHEFAATLKTLETLQKMLLQREVEKNKAEE